MKCEALFSSHRFFIFSIETLQRRLDSVYDDKLDGAITTQTWERKHSEMVAEQASIQDQIVQLKDLETQYFEIGINILDLARRAREIYEKRSPAQRRLLLSYIFSNLLLKDRNIAYFLTEPIEQMSKRVQERIDEKNTFEPSTLPINKQQTPTLGGGLGILLT